LTLTAILSSIQREWIGYNRRVNAYTRAAQFEL
jgi:hypothetical protein